MQSRHYFGFGELFSAEIALHQGLIGFRNGIEQDFPALCGVFFEFVRELCRIAENADDPLEVRAFSDRQCHGNADVFPVCFLKL